jgi:hypothetical protein
MKTPFAVTPALTRAQIDAIVSAGAIRPDSPSGRWQSDAIQRSQGPAICNARDAETRGAQSVRTAAAAATYGCVDWYIYPADSHGESEAA